MLLLLFLIIYLYHLMDGINVGNEINLNNQNSNIIHVRASEIVKIFSSPENRHAFAVENSKLI